MALCYVHPGPGSFGATEKTALVSPTDFLPMEPLLAVEIMFVHLWLLYLVIKLPVNNVRSIIGNDVGDRKEVQIQLQKHIKDNSKNKNSSFKVILFYISLFHLLDRAAPSLKFQVTAREHWKSVLEWVVLIEVMLGGNMLHLKSQKRR